MNGMQRASLAAAAGLAMMLAGVGPARAQMQGLAPPIDHPDFLSAARVRFLKPDDRVIGVTQGGTAKAYPVMIVATHHIVHDQLADGPIAVTW
jgi:hypothetical protein